MNNWIWVAGGGAIGALLRYGVTLLSTSWYGKDYPYGTLKVNLLGALLIGIIWVFSDRLSISEAAKHFILIGLLGAFTTFSTFSLDTMKLVHAGNTRGAISYVLFSNLGCIALVFIGYQLAHFILNLKSH